MLVKHTAAGLELWLPDYPGNLFFNTLGNLAQHPLAGLLWVDYEDGGLLRGRPRRAAVGEADRAPWPGAQRVLRLLVLGGVARAGAALAVDAGAACAAVQCDAADGGDPASTPTRMTRSR